jgi:pectate lyase
MQGKSVNANRHGNQGFSLISTVAYLFYFALQTIFAAQPNFECAGFATQNGGTKGGQGGQTVSASNYSQLKSYAENSASYIIMVNGTISNGSGGGQIRVRSNKSIIGVGSTAFLSGVGIDVSSQNNLILRNLRIALVGTSNPGGVNGGDCISISGTSKNIWIDHCELFSEDPAVQTDKDKYDGLVDIKGQTGFITISWCYLRDHHKGGLVGAADDDLFDNRKITFHHNCYKKVKLRIPMFRGSTGHFFNNYITGATDATEIRAGTCVRVEKNYYDSLHYSIYTPTDAPGSAERIDNIEISRASRAYPTDCKAAIPYDYAHVLTDTTEDVRTIVPLYAGVGKIGNDPSGIAAGPDNVLASRVATAGRAGEMRILDLRGKLVFKGSRPGPGLPNGILIENARGVNRVIYCPADRGR